MSQNNQNDNSMDALWICAIALAAYFAIQIWFGDSITWLYVQIRWAWLAVITTVWHGTDLMMLRRLVETRQSSELSPDQLDALSTSLRWFMFPIWGGLVGYMGYKAIKKNPGRRFQRKLTRKTLAEEMSGEFPWVLPSLRQDLISLPINEGPWAMAQTPLQFARRYRLLTGKTIDTRRAEKLFASQLGKLWSGPERLNPIAKSLFACFAAQVCHDKDGAYWALRELVESDNKGKLVFDKSNALLKKYGQDPRVAAICKRHAYQYTVMIAMFAEGKSNGIFPPNHFLWVRPVKRTLWLTLNCVLRRTPFVEVGGIYAHYLAEKVANHKIETPQVSKAVSALEIAIRDVDFDATDLDVKDFIKAQDNQWKREA